MASRYTLRPMDAEREMTHVTIIDGEIAWFETAAEADEWAKAALREAKQEGRAISVYVAAGRKQNGVGLDAEPDGTDAEPIEWRELAPATIRGGECDVVRPRIGALVYHGLRDERGRLIGGNAVIATAEDMGCLFVRVQATRDGEHFGASTPATRIEGTDAAAMSKAKDLASRKLTEQRLRYVKARGGK